MPDATDAAGGAHAVLTEARDGVLLITLNRPGQRNAVNLAVAEGVSAALDRLDVDDALRIGILTGAGKGFCAGMDLKAFVAGERPYTERGFAGIVERPSRKPLIAAVEGFAVAGGFEIALACDLIVAARGARLGIPEVARGLVEALAVARDLAARIAANAPLALAASKRVLVEAPDWPATERWARQAEVVVPVRASEDAREGARAFAERREPVWRGR